MHFNSKRIILSILIICGLAISFWLGSRYPQLNEKAMMAGDTPFMGLSFDTPLNAELSNNIFLKVAYNTLNWIETNKKGMIFGVLFAAALMVLLSLLEQKSFKNTWLNSVMGTIIGAPLGVCVNCAAPIAQGMKSAGAKPETALSTMLSSPTLNVIVITMLFSLFPLKFVIIKLGVTAVLLFIVVPILTRWIPTKEAVAIADDHSKLSSKLFPGIDENVSGFFGESWWSALKGTAFHYFKSLWFMIKVAVPLMLLAGLLGNVLITLLPFDALFQYAHNYFEWRWLIVVGLALFCTFLPVPMTFDIIISAVFWSLGLPIKYVLVMLITLGSYSIYAHFIVQKTFSYRIAIGIFIAVSVLGTIGSYVGHRWYGEEINAEEQLIVTKMNQSTKLKTYKSPDWQQKILTADEIRNLDIINPMREKVNIDGLPANVEVWRIPFKKIAAHSSGGKLFNQIEGHDLGIVAQTKLTVKNTISPYSHTRNISSGNINNDDWPDLAITSFEELHIYINIGGERFQEQKLNWPDTLPAMCVALVDLDNDGWEDLFVSTYLKGNYAWLNEFGEFKERNIERIPMPEGHMYTIAPAFGDINRDGKPDILTGNWSIGPHVAKYSVDESKNYLLLSNEGKELSYSYLNLSGQNGETLSTLISDFDQDGDLDLIVGNDFLVPDYYYRNENGIFHEIEKEEGVHSIFPWTTMSVITADLDNDLDLESLHLSISPTNFIEEDDSHKICGSIINPQERRSCEDFFQFRKRLSNSTRRKSLMPCFEDEKIDCALGRIRNRISRPAFDSLIQQHMPDDAKDLLIFKPFANRMHKPVDTVSETSQRDLSVILRNVGNRYEDYFESSGLTNTGWAWNSKVADVDNDGDKDLFVATGFFLMYRYHRNNFYANNGEGYFEDISEESGLDSYLPISSYTYVDYNKDGKIDIIAAPNMGPILVHKNVSNTNNSISFKIEDQSGGVSKGINSSIIIELPDGGKQIQEILKSGGFKSFDYSAVVFGTGQFDKLSQVIIQQSSGETIEIKETLEVGYEYTIVIK